MSLNRVGRPEEGVDDHQICSTCTEHIGTMGRRRNSRTLMSDFCIRRVAAKEHAAIGGLLRLYGDSALVDTELAARQVHLTIKVDSELRVDFLAKIIE